ncbi:MAG: TRAP transporter substrate-binding protein [Alphaproteobacteria bacterium]|jgi:tripartite ATP-independent transporter DctP family solute receptor|nr:TRAP transporter substrate-binding protein [Alphaproteobacteria bacterium]MBU2042814.1 TRAP transporter substrate-binding protein [Alphaproteobacteria bacterium]MBU2125310.1 TRAP transporter substrate-binding protein [Alphaproteobacteria bacterium]MBU2208002.1 TRAP transporter substrate-binding protein [Alphaproteobacteria bacterium]MBU2291556.1 TRAP transporter substrate-binding protein [Alphaproteobacteria bacterium]
MSLTRRALGLASLSGLGLAACAPRSVANGQTIFNAVDVHPGDFPTVTAVKWIGEELGRLTDGRLGVRQFPSGQLGNEDDSIGLTRFRAVDMCRVAVAALNNAFPETRLLALPYVFRSVPHVRAVVDGEIGTELLNVFEGRGLVGLAYYDAAPRCFYNVRHPVTEPGQLRGLKMRAPQSDIFLDSIRAMGANPTPLTFGAVFSSLQTHLIDGAENNWPAYQSSRQYEVARYWSQTEHSFSPDALLMSKTSFDAMTPADQELVRDVARRSVQVMRVDWDAREASAREAVIAAGVQVAEVDKDAFAATVRPVLDKYLAEPRLRALHERIAAVA